MITSTARNQMIATIACLLCVPQAHAAAALKVSAPNAFVDIAPGASADVALRIDNVGDEASAADAVVIDKPLGYRFEQRTAPDCGTLTDAPDGHSFRFAVPAIATGASLICTIRITREASAIDSVYLGAAVASDYFGSLFSLFVGTFANIALGSEQVSYDVDASGIAHGVFRLSAKNTSAVPVAAFNAATCTYETTIENDLDGGCAATTSVCAPGQIPFVAQGALFPPLAPGQEASCLVRVSAPVAENASATLLLDEEHEWGVYLIDSATGGHVFDSDPADNSTQLPLRPTGAESGTSSVPALSPAWLVLMASLLTMIVFVSLTRAAKH